MYIYLMLTVKKNLPKSNTFFYHLQFYFIFFCKTRALNIAIGPLGYTMPSLALI